MDRDQGRKKCGDRHKERNRYAVGTGKIVRRAEANGRSEGGDRQGPIDDRHIDLAPLLARGVEHAQPWKKPELDCLLGERKCAGDDRLRRNYRCDCSERNERVVKPIGGELIKRILERVRLC